MTRKEWNYIKSAFDIINGKVAALKNQVDELGKVVQTEDGNGTMEDPIKNWSVGKPVISGLWYLTPVEGYLWEAIKDGVPTSETDREYFDVVGL